MATGGLIVVALLLSGANALKQEERKTPEDGSFLVEEHPKGAADVVLSKIMGSTADPDDMAKWMGMLNSLGEASTNDNFMAGMTKAGEDKTKESTRYAQAGTELVAKFAERVLVSPDKTVPLLAQLYDDQNDLFAAHRAILQKVDVQIQSFVPPVLNKSLAPLYENKHSSTEAEVIRASSLLANVAGPDACPHISILLTNITAFKDYNVKAGTGINATLKMLPMMKEYFDAVHPDKSTRVMYLMSNILNNAYTEVSALTKPPVAMIDAVRAAVAAGTECFLSGATAPSSCLLGMFFAVVSFFTAGSMLR